MLQTTSSIVRLKHEGEWAEMQCKCIQRVSVAFCCFLLILMSIEISRETFFRCDARGSYSHSNGLTSCSLSAIAIRLIFEMPKTKCNCAVFLVSHGRMRRIVIVCVEHASVLDENTSSAHSLQRPNGQLC